MKKQVVIPVSNTLALALVLFMALLCISELNADSGFVRYYDISAEIVPGYVTTSVEVDTRAIYTTSDNGAVVLARTRWSPDEMQVWYALTVVKLDSLGNQVWQRYYHPNYADVLNIVGIGIDSNDNVTALCDMGQLYLVSIGSNGDINRVLFDYPPWGIDLTKALQEINGDIVAIGVQSFIYSTYVFYYRYSSSGDLIQSIQIPADSTFSHARATDAVIDDDGNVLIACRLNSEYLEVIKLEPNGNTLERYPLPGYLAYSNGNYWIHLSYLPGSNHILAVHPFDTGLPFPNNHRTTLTRITESSVTSQIFNELNYPNSIVEFSSGVYIASQNYSDIEGIFRLDFGGDYELSWIWTQCLGGWSDSGSSDLLSIGRNNAVYTAKSYSLSRIYVGKVLHHGQVPLVDEVQTPELNVLLAYPNPMKDVLNISLKRQNNNIGDNTRIGIYNIRGQLVRSIELGNSNSESKVVWDGKDEAGFECSSGIYILRVIGSRGSVMRVCKTNRE